MKEAKKGTALGVKYRIHTVNKKGETINDTDFRECKSFVRNFMLSLWAQLTYDSAGIATQDITGAAKNLRGVYISNFQMIAGAEDTTLGIVVGTGTTPVAYDDYALETLIAQGNGAGQLLYDRQPRISNIGFDGNVIFLEITRPFTNDSGGSITINEIGLYYYNYTTAGLSKFLGIRDIVSPGYSFPDETTVFVTFKIYAEL